MKRLACGGQPAVNLGTDAVTRGSLGAIRLPDTTLGAYVPRVITTRPALLATVVIAVALTGAPLAAQTNLLSQLGTVTQLVRDTHIEIVYRRPVARGRELFGALVPWGRVWTPSADSAVRFKVSGPVDVNGSALAAGEYSLWTIPDPKTWTVIFNQEAVVFHLRYPDGRDVLRVQATPKSGEHMETLAFYFPVVDADSAILYLHWGTTIVPITIRAKR